MEKETGLDQVTIRREEHEEGTEQQDTHGLLQQVMREIAGVLTQNADTLTIALADEIEQVYKKESSAFLHGVGREGLMMKGLAMRLFHLGISVHCIGDMTTPPIKHGDLFLVSAGPGRFSTIQALAGVAHRAGARVVLLTAQPQVAEDHHLGIVDRILSLPASTMADHNPPGHGQGIAGHGLALGPTNPGQLLPMGSAYEGALFVLFEILVLKLFRSLSISDEAMRARHTNLE